MVNMVWLVTEYDAEGNFDFVWACHSLGSAFNCANKAINVVSDDAAVAAYHRVR